MSKMFYRYLTRSPGEIRSAMELLESLIQKDILTGVSSRRILEDESGIIKLGLTCVYGGATIEKSILSEDNPYLQKYKESMEFVPIADTQESLYLCWEALILLSLEISNDIWLNTFHEDYIPSHIRVQRVSFSDGKSGLLFPEDEFRKFQLDD